MATKTFVNGSTVIDADWANDVDALTYDNSISWTPALTAPGATLTAASATGRYRWLGGKTYAVQAYIQLASSGLVLNGNTVSLVLPPALLTDPGGNAAPVLRLHRWIGLATPIMGGYSQVGTVATSNQIRVYTAAMTSGPNLLVATDLANGCSLYFYGVIDLGK